MTSPIISTLDHNIRALNLLVGDSSNLILDPILDSYYLMDAVLLSLPKADALLNEVIDAAAPVGGSASAARLRSHDVMAALLKETLDSLSSDYRVATGYNTALKSVLDPAWQEYQASLSATLTALRDNPGGRSGSVPSAALTRAQAALGANFKLFDATLPALDRLLQERINRLGAAKTSTIAIVVVGILAGSLLAIWAVRGAAHPLPAHSAPDAEPGQRPREDADSAGALGKLAAENQRLKTLVADLLLEHRARE